MTDFTDVSGPATSWTSKDSIAIQNPGFEDCTGDWPCYWVLVLGASAQVGSKVGDSSDVG